MVRLCTIRSFGDFKMSRPVLCINYSSVYAVLIKIVSKFFRRWHGALVLDIVQHVVVG